MDYLKIGICILLPFLAVLVQRGSETGSPGEVRQSAVSPAYHSSYPMDLSGTFTGGFGEESCHSCHFDNSVNDDAGRLKLEGVPESYKPGDSYKITVILTRNELEKGGFQLAARHPDSAQAGSFQLDSPRLQFTDAGGSVRYVQHTAEGTEPGEENLIRWNFEWTAPENGRGVRFHLAANAGNGDESSFGDHIYTLNRTVKPAGD